MISRRDRPAYRASGLMLGCLALACTSFAGMRTPVATSEIFAFHNDRQTNLNDALIATGVERRFGRDELFRAGPEASCFDALAPSLQKGWELAVEFYTEVVSPSEFGDRQQYFLRLQLAGMQKSLDDEPLRRYLDVVAGMQGAAMPAYDACRWPLQRERNRTFIEDILPQLEKHESEIAGRLEKLYRKPWPGSRIDVDVVETVSWAGANSVFPPDFAGHVLIAAESRGHASLETVFHEASHGFMFIGDPLRADLAVAAEKLGVPRPKGLWHVALFHTTGDTVRQVLLDAGEADYTPMIYEIYERSDWARYRTAFADVWPQVISGERASGDAAVELLAAIGDFERDERRKE